MRLGGRDEIAGGLVDVREVLPYEPSGDSQGVESVALDDLDAGCQAVVVVIGEAWLSWYGLSHWNDTVWRVAGRMDQRYVGERIKDSLSWGLGDIGDVGFVGLKSGGAN